MSIFRKQSNKHKVMDALWSKAVKIVAGEKCERCYKTERLNSHHIFGRRMKSVRWDLDNGVCLCPGCHTLSSNFSAHQTPTEFTLWIIRKRGQPWYNRLQLKAYTPGKPDEEMTKIYLKSIIKEQA